MKKEETGLAITLPTKSILIEKTSFALPEKTFKKLFKASDEVYVCGCDYDSCVLAICFQLFDHGFQPHILLDAVGSHSQKSVKKTDFVKICQKNFGKCSLIETNTL